MRGTKTATLALVVLCAWSFSRAVPKASAQGRTDEIKMTARKYAFRPDRVAVKQGDHVRLLITSVDHEHGFKLEGYAVNQLLKKGATVVIEFTADKAGTFQFECSHFCGLGHSKMRGELVVEP